MCTERHRIYDQVLSQLLTISDSPPLSQILHVNSCPSSGTDRPCHQLESDTCQHCFNTPCTICLTTCLTTSALVCRYVPCLPHASPLSRCRASAVLVESPGSRTHTTQTPTTENHRSSPTDAEYHVSIRPLALVRSTCLSLSR